MSLILLIILCSSIIAGIMIWEKNRIASFLCFSPLFILIMLTGYVFYQSLYEVTIDSLQLHIDRKYETFIVKGNWEEGLDEYRFPVAFAAFYVPGNGKISNIKRNNVKNTEEMDWEALNLEVKKILKEEYESEWEPQIIDIEPDEQFQFSFTLPENVKPNEVKLYYVHVREKPMDSLEYWLKNIDLK
ncbi:hypothetical protein [Metabacillus fastidiosus]|uniref:hypothetical protein n=1 Tax=Metabacillus fastidiosus TaxID=1458 RepID=UPI003D26D4AA